MEPMLGGALDVFRLRQYFNVITRTREFVEGVREDAGFLDDARRALVTLPFDRRHSPTSTPSRRHVRGPTDLRQRRLALLATGGSGALASVVGAARALEEAGVRPSSSRFARAPPCSGSPSPPASPPRRLLPSRSDCDPMTTSTSTGACWLP